MNAAPLTGIRACVFDAYGTFETLNTAWRTVAFSSSNAWDAYAASAFALRVVWCNRYGQKAERLPGHPDREITSLAELPNLVRA